MTPPLTVQIPFNEVNGEEEQNCICRTYSSEVFVQQKGGVCRAWIRSAWTSVVFRGPSVARRLHCILQGVPMQPVPLRSIKASLSRRMRFSGEDILHFSLQGVLPSGHLLAVNPLLGTLSYIVNEDHHPRLVMQQQFTAGEMSVLMPLLEAYPYYCPYETLLAGFQYG